MVNHEGPEGFDGRGAIRDERRYADQRMAPANDLHRNPKTVRARSLASAVR
jgi:hypothetical protein